MLSKDSCYTDGAFSVRSGESGPYPGSEVSSTRARNGYESMCGMSEDAAKLVQLYQDKNRLTTDLRKMKVELTKTRDENTQLKKRHSHQLNAPRASCSSCRGIGTHAAPSSCSSNKAKSDVEERKSIGATSSQHRTGDPDQ